MVDGCSSAADVAKQLAAMFPNSQHQPALDLPLRELQESLLPAEEWKVLEWVPGVGSGASNYLLFFRVYNSNS